MTTTTLNARRLLRLIDSTMPHMAGEHVGPLNGIRFDHDGAALHAVATDRYTIAVARARLRSKGPSWARTVAAEDIRTIRPWLDAHDGSQYVDIEIVDNQFSLSSDRGTLLFTTAPADNVWPEWRGLFRTAMNAPLSEVPFTVLDTRFMARWQEADSHVRVWQSEAMKPYIVVGENFLGMQMPARARGGTRAEDETREQVIADWAASLGEGNEPVEMEAPAEGTALPEMAESFLHQTLNSTWEMYGADMDTVEQRAAFNAWVSSGIYAWSAYRMLEALRTADPQLAEETVSELNDQLESGEIGEWAWDAAEKAGHDPQKWHDDYEAHLKALAEKKAADEAEQPSA